MGKPLIGKKAIIEYIQGEDRLGDTSFKECILLKLPCFRSGRRLMSHTDAIDQWFITLSLGHYGITSESDIEEDGDPSSC